jgi:hypothetical protein
VRPQPLPSVTPLPLSRDAIAAPPVPGSSEELAAFAAIQAEFPAMFDRVFSNNHAPRTVIVVPSLSLDTAELAKIDGAAHYEERMLCLLMLLRLPQTQIIYVTSQSLPPSVVDYYLHLLPGVPASHARRRLMILSCDDGSAIPLTQKILHRPRLLRRIRDAIRFPDAAHITCFNSTSLERTLAVRLNAPLYAADPALAHYGTKSGSREVFKEAGIDLPDGVEGVRDIHDVSDALDGMIGRRPSLRRAVLKLDEGFSGEGNALIDLTGVPRTGIGRWLRTKLPERLEFAAVGETWPSFEEKLGRMGGIVEAFVSGADPASPSVQCRIDPLGNVAIVSTHDQVLGGSSGQIFLGCRFPADPTYRVGLHEAGRAVGDVLRDRGVIGRFAVDFVTVREGDRMVNYAIEINLRKGGTTLPYLMLQYLTNGEYDPESDGYRTALGESRFYHATDNLQRDEYRTLTPRDLVDIVVEQGLHFDSTTQEGVVFHLIGAISEWGKLGVLSVGTTMETAEARFRETVAILDREAGL